VVSVSAVFAGGGRIPSRRETTHATIAESANPRPVQTASTPRVEIEPENRIRRKLEGVDSVIFCTGYAPRKAETVALESLGVPVYYAGDVLGSRKFFQAIEEGTMTALKIL